MSVEFSSAQPAAPEQEQDFDFAEKFAENQEHLQKMVTELRELEAVDLEKISDFAWKHTPKADRRKFKLFGKKERMSESELPASREVGLLINRVVARTWELRREIVRIKEEQKILQEAILALIDFDEPVETIPAPSVSESVPVENAEGQEELPEDVEPIKQELEQQVEDTGRLAEELQKKLQDYAAMSSEERRSERGRDIARAIANKWAQLKEKSNQLAIEGAEKLEIIEQALTGDVLDEEQLADALADAQARIVVLEEAVEKAKEKESEPPEGGKEKTLEEHKQEAEEQAAEKHDDVKQYLRGMVGEKVGVGIFRAMIATRFEISIYATLILEKKLMEKGFMIPITVDEEDDFFEILGDNKEEGSNKPDQEAIQREAREVYDRAKEHIIEEHAGERVKGLPRILARRFNISQEVADEIVTTLEQERIVSAEDGDGFQEVLIKREPLLELSLEDYDAVLEKFIHCDSKELTENELRQMFAFSYGVPAEYHNGLIARLKKDGFLDEYEKWNYRIIKDPSEVETSLDLAVEEKYMDVATHFVEEFGGDWLEDSRLRKILKQIYFLEDDVIEATLARLEEDEVISGVTKDGRRQVAEEIEIET